MTKYFSYLDRVADYTRRKISVLSLEPRFGLITFHRIPANRIAPGHIRNIPTCTRVYSRSVDKTTGLRVDQTVTLNIWRSRHIYPEHLRRIKFFDTTQERTLVFLTNNFTLDPLTIASLYKCRWQIELFFKWIKQHLQIKAFYGTSFNAVASQVWIAISIYTLVAIVKKELRLNFSLYTILQILSLTLFEKMPINQVFADSQLHFHETSSHNQLTLFNF